MEGKKKGEEKNIRLFVLTFHFFPSSNSDCTPFFGSHPSTPTQQATF